jgi:ribosomal protein S17E
VINKHFGGYITKLPQRKKKKEKTTNSEFSKIWKNGNKA